MRRNGGLISLDVGNIARVQQVGREEFRARIDKVAPEVLFANEEEAAALWPAGDVSAPGLVVVKHGALAQRCLRARRGGTAQRARPAGARSGGHNRGRRRDGGRVPGRLGFRVQL